MGASSSQGNKIVKENSIFMIPISKCQSGDSVVTGGNSEDRFATLQNYANSTYSKAKDQLIRNIIFDVFSALKASSDKLSKMSTSELVNAFVKTLPPSIKNPKAFNDAFNKSDTKQKEVCIALANAINKNYNGAVIDTGADPKVMCAKIVEVLHSLLQGLHTEFITIAGDVERVLQNMRLAEDYLESAYKRQRELVASVSDADLNQQSSEVDKVYQEVKAEYNRQGAILANLMDITITPTTKSLISALEDNKEFSGLVANLKEMAGTESFGRKLSSLLSGISSATYMAELVNKSLAKIGLEFSEFKNAKNAAELRSRVYKRIVESNPSPLQLEELLTAAKIIYEANYNHEEISKLIEAQRGKDGKGKKGGDDSDVVDNDSESSESSGGEDSDQKHENVVSADGSDGVMGGNDDELPLYWKKKSLSRKVKNSEKLRNLILKDFRNELKNILREIIDAANKVSKSIGVDVPADDNLKYFIDAFSTIPNLDQDKLHIALSGYPKDSMSKEKRDIFLNAYALAANACAPLLKGPNGDQFKSISNGLTKMINTIDQFSEKIVKVITEIPIERPDELIEHIKKTTGLFYGAGNSEFSDDGSWVAFDKVKGEMKYFYAIANIKNNLKFVKDESRAYSSHYEQILGEEAAWIIDRIKKQHVDRIADIEAVAASGAVPATATGGYRRLWADNVLADILDINGRGGINANAKQQLKDDYVKNLKAMLAFQMNAKVDLIKVAQAVDLYMKSFTDGIMQNPEAIGDLVNMLKSIELIAKWFNDLSGNVLTSMMDLMPNDNGGLSILNPIQTDGSIKIADMKDHYYQQIDDIMNVGTPYNSLWAADPGFDSKKGEGIVTLVSKVSKSMKALENIVQVFMRVGSKVGDVSPVANTFMNEAQMYNSLCNYVAASTLNIFPNSSVESNNVYKINNFRNLSVQIKENNENKRKSREYDSLSNQKKYLVDLRNKLQAELKSNQNLLGIANANLDALNTSLNTAMTDAKNNKEAKEVLIKSIESIKNEIKKSISHLDDLHNERYNIRNYLSNALNSMDNVTMEDAKKKVSEIKMPPAIINQILNNTVNVDDIKRNIQTEINKLSVDIERFKSHKTIHTKHLDDIQRERLGGAPLPESIRVGLCAIPKVSDARINTEPNVFNERQKFYDISTMGSSDLCQSDMLDRNDDFVQTDAIFQMIIKAITAKIFTSIDIYRLFHRPVADQRASYSLNPVRTIMGGEEEVEGGSAPIKIYPEALDLYYRLVLLAEWYREHFGAESESRLRVLHKDSWRVTILSNMDGMWADLVSIVFDQAAHVQDGNYTETQCKKMILAINAVWKQLSAKNPKLTTKNVLDMFVIEMNRSFGFLKQSDIDTYLQNKIKNLEGLPASNNDDDFLDFDTLHAEDQMGARAAPSDRFSKINTLNTTTLKKKSMVLLHNVVEELRNRIDKEFLDNTDPLDRSTDIQLFSRTMRNFRNDMTKAKSADEEYKIVLGMMQNVNRRSQFSVEKLIMLHETVVAPLVVLYGVYKVLARFNAFAHGASVKNIVSYYNTINPNKPNIYDLRDAYSNHLSGKLYKKEKDMSVTGMFASILTGNALQPNLLPAQPLRHGGYVFNSNTSTFDTILWSKISEDMIAVLLDFGTNQAKLVEVSVSAVGSINMNFAPIEDECRALLAQTKENLRKLKIGVDVSELSRFDIYEQMANAGSIRWLEENLMQKLFASRDESGLSHAISLFKESFDSMAKDFSKYPGSLLGGEVKEILDENKQMPSLYAAVANHLYYHDNVPLSERYNVELSKFPGNVLLLSKKDPTAAEMKIMNDYGKIGNITNANKAQLINSTFPIPVIGFQNHENINLFSHKEMICKSLFRTLNRTLYMYLNLAVEPNVPKMYAPLIEQFAVNAAALEYNASTGYPDVFNVLDNDNNNTQCYNCIAKDIEKINQGQIDMPNVDKLINKSTSLIMKNILTAVLTTGSVQRKPFLYASVSEIPEFMKDKYRVNLPYFIKMFKILENRADLLKKLLNLTQLSKNVSSPAKQAIIAAANPTGYTTLNDNGSRDLVNMYDKNTDEIAKYFNNLLSRIIDCSQQLQKCAEGVYREMQDKPAPVSELYKDFMQDFKLRNQKQPIMPFSHLLAPLQAQMTRKQYWNSQNASQLLMPVTENGSAVYKYNTAYRFVYNKSDTDLNLEHFPGAKEIFNMYAAGSDKSNSLSPTEYSNTLQHIFKINRFLADGVVYNRQFDRPNRQLETNHGSYESRNVFAQVQFPVVPNAISNGLYSIHNEIRNVVGLVEQSDVFVCKNDLVSKIILPSTEILPVQRARMRVYNILDAGIVPLNVHAFMREVPFINLFNYSYTFDRMAGDMIGNRSKPHLGMLIDYHGAVNSPRELFYRLLVNPHYINSDGKLRNDEYFSLVASLFNGDDDLKLGRPKYLSDQLWHKVLLTSSAQSGDGNELPFLRGPSAYEAMNKVNKNTLTLPHMNDSYVYTHDAHPVAELGLRYLKNGKWVTVHEQVLNRNAVYHLALNGEMRYNTKIVRNLVWFTNIQRLMRVALTKHLSWINTPVVRGLKITNPDITEYENNEKYNADDFNGLGYSMI